MYLCRTWFALAAVYTYQVRGNGLSMGRVINHVIVLIRVSLMSILESESDFSRRKSLVSGYGLRLLSCMFYSFIIFF